VSKPALAYPKQEYVAQQKIGTSPRSNNPLNSFPDLANQRFNENREESRPRRRDQKSV